MSRPITTVENDKQKILVTGAGGFVGGAVMCELQKACQYKALGLGGRQAFEMKASGDILFQADISNPETLKKLENLKPINTVIHSAGLAHQFGRVEREDFWRVNVRGTENICRLAQQIDVRHLILISSVAVYGDYGNASIDETFECRPSGVYAESKLESEKRAIEFCEGNNIPLTILRLATVIGEGDKGSTTRLITAVDKGYFVWVGNGCNKKSLIYRQDAAHGILKTIEAAKAKGTRIYNLSAEAVKMSEVVDAISESLGKKTLPFKIPENLVRTVFRVKRAGLFKERFERYERTFEKWLADDVFSGKKFNEAFNFKPETPISEALARQVKYYLKQKREFFEV